MPEPTVPCHHVGSQHLNGDEYHVWPGHHLGPESEALEQQHQQYPWACYKHGFPPLILYSSSSVRNRRGLFALKCPLASLMPENDSPTINSLLLCSVLIVCLDFIGNLKSSQSCFLPSDVNDGFLASFGASIGVDSCQGTRVNKWKALTVWMIFIIASFKLLSRSIHPSSGAPNMG